MQLTLGLSFVKTLLVINTPQLLLSFCYFSLNAFITRLLVEKEWNLFSLSQRPLRVSRPRGDQISSYRLQLPYRYSLPLMTISGLLHWVLSNSFFFYIIEGGKLLGPILHVT